MKLTLRSGGEVRDLTVVRRGDTARVTVAASGETISVRVHRGPRGRLVLRAEGRRLEVAGSRLGSGARQLWLNGRVFSYQSESAGGAREQADDLQLAATIPAVVLEVLVEPGSHVAEGERLVLLESMKMVLPISATRPGRVDAILCQAGDAVEPGAPLIEFTPDDEAMS